MMRYLALVVLDTLRYEEFEDYFDWLLELSNYFRMVREGESVKPQSELNTTVELLDAVRMYLQSQLGFQN